jgi:hypothetical protein
MQTVSQPLRKIFLTRYSMTLVNILNILNMIRSSKENYKIKNMNTKYKSCVYFASIQLLIHDSKVNKQTRSRPAKNKQTMNGPTELVRISQKSARVSQGSQSRSESVRGNRSQLESVGLQSESVRVLENLILGLICAYTLFLLATPFCACLSLKSKISCVDNTLK